MKRLISVVLCVAALALLSSGCTPVKEIKELAIVEGVGVDKNPNGSYMITFQIFSPQGGGGGGNQSSQNQTTNLQSTGVSLFDAVRNMTKQTGKKLYFSNVQAVIFGRAICSGDFVKMLDFMERNHEISPTERVFMAENRAEDILTAKGAQGSIAAADIAKISQNYYNTSMLMDVQLNDIEREEGFGSNDIALPVLSVRQGAKTGGGSGGSGSSSSSGSQVVEINSTAVFSGNRFAGTLTPAQTRGVMWVVAREKVSSGVINVRMDNGGDVSMEIMEDETGISVSEKDGEPVVKVVIGFTTRLAENESGAAVNAAFFQRVLRLQNEAVRNEAQSALDAALIKYKSDIFDFGEAVFQDQPSLWHKISGTWKERLPTLQVEMEIHSRIEDEGMITK